MNSLYETRIPSNTKPILPKQRREPQQKLTALRDSRRDLQGVAYSVLGFGLGFALLLGLLRHPLMAVITAFTAGWVFEKLRTAEVNDD